MTNIMWLRRDLQIHDNASINKAVAAGDDFQPIFIFDTEILTRFSNKKDRRLSFLANALFELNKEFSQHGGGVLILHGKAAEIVPKLAKEFSGKVFAGEDYEAGTRKRDEEVGKQVELILSIQHVLLHPNRIKKDDGNPLKVFTPYSKRFRAAINDSDTEEYHNRIEGKLADVESSAKKAQQLGLKVIEVNSAKQMVEDIGYEFFDENIWSVKDVQERLAKFVESKIGQYEDKRNFPAIDFTSLLSPYLRFGLITPRQCYNAAVGANNSYTWINELIWREFYITIMFHYPESAKQEFIAKYRGLEWRNDEDDIQAWKDGNTGYPIVDAGMRQLKRDGWMHNRVRMIVASFLTKDLLIDWRVGEEHFAQYLMDYEMASNVGGWQWSSSTGTDAAPYFRVFNPILQSKRFDNEGEYIREYIPELELLPNKEIHAPWEKAKPANYAAPIVDRAIVKDRVMAFFKVGDVN